MANWRSRASWRRRGVAAATVVVSSSLASLAYGVLPSVQYDLRVSGIGGKEFTVSSLDDFVLLDLYATVTGLDGDPTNDRLSAGSGFFASSNGGLLADMEQAFNVSPFTLPGSTPGVPLDVDGDGDLDVGRPSNDTNWFGYRNYPPTVDQPPGGYLVGQVQLTFWNQLEIAHADTQITFAARTLSGASAALDGSNLITLSEPGKMLITYGAPVVIHGVPEGDSGAAEYISGTIASHTAISTHQRCTAYETLTYSTGLDLVPGGMLDGATESYVVVNVNDSVSGNAGGTLSVDELNIGTTSSGTYTHSAGLTRAAYTSVGAGLGVTGALLVSGGSFRGAIGVGPGSSFKQTGGDTVLQELDLFRGSSAEMAGGTLLVGGPMQLLIEGSGPTTFTHSGGTTQISGAMTLTNGLTFKMQGGTLSAGSIDRGTFQHTGGSISCGTLKVASSSYKLSGSAQLHASSLLLGNSGFFTQSGGDVFLAGTTNTLGDASTTTAQYALSGGTFNATNISVEKTNATPVAATGRKGMMVQTGGTVNLQNITIKPTGTYDALGGTINVARQLTQQGTFDFGGGNATLNLGNNCFADFKGPILNATGATFTGGAGSLMNFAAGFDPLAQIGVIDTLGLVHVAGQPLVIPADKSVGGSGTIDGNVTNNGTVSPGNSPGAITISGNYTQGSSATLQMEIAGAAGGQFDQLAITNLATLGGNLNISLLGGYIPQASDQFPILTAANVSGNFANAIGKVNFNGGRFDVLYSSTGVTLTNFQVPEPAGAVLLMLGSGAGLLRRRRKEPA